MLNSVTIMGRIRKITRAEPGRAGQSRIYVEADVERDFVNAEGARAADAVELVLYGKQADGFRAAEGDLAAFAGALRTRYAEPDASGRRAPITYIDVRRVYGTSDESPYDRQARAPGWNASDAGARELPAREADSRPFDRAWPVGTGAARSGAPSGEPTEFGASRAGSFSGEATVGAALGASRAGSVPTRAGSPSGEDAVGAAFDTSRAENSPMRAWHSSTHAGSPLGEEAAGAELNAPERAGHSTARAETDPTRASWLSDEEAAGVGPGTSRAGAAQVGATRPSPGGPGGGA